jgi:hypothetical protein
MEDKMKKVWKVVISIVCILCSSYFAIFVHSQMPSPGAPLNVDDFNSLAIKLLGFPLVASAYFVILYSHILLVIILYGRKSGLNNLEIGLRYGSVFGLIYMAAMQEVVVESSPFSSWGSDYVAYQLFMGLGDAIPVLVLSIVISFIMLPLKKAETQKEKFNTRRDITAIIAIAVTFFIERMAGYLIGYIDNDLEKFTVPVTVWTAVFGVVLGIVYILIRPIYSAKANRSNNFHIAVITIGLNWMIFNSFIGMIMAGTIGKTILRSGIDTIILFITISLHNKYFSSKHID